MTSSSQESFTATDLNTRLTDLLTGLVHPLIDHPKSLRIESESGEGGTTFRLYLAPDDLGKVIGKQGRTARSIRTILSAIGSKSNQRLMLDVLETE